MTTIDNIKSTQAFLHAHGIDVAPTELAMLLEEAIAILPKNLYPSSPDSDLSSGEAAALRRGGFDLADRALGKDDPLARTTAKYAALLRTSLTVTEVAKMLGVNPSRIRQRLSKRNRTLYGIRVGARWYIPAFQFVNGQHVPGIASALQKIDSSLHPVSILNWFVTPNPDLEATTDLQLSPLDWLLQGFPTETVAELATNL